MSSISSNSRIVLPECNLRDRAVENAVDSARAGPRQFALHHALAALARAIEQRQQGLGAARQFGDAPAQRLIGAEAQQGLRRGVQVLDVQVLVQQEHAGHQAIEQLGALDAQRVQMEFSSQAERPCR